MKFKVGDRVIHPRHGLGEVTQMAVKEFVEGQKRLFYEIAFPSSTLWLPLNVSDSGIRKLATKRELEKCRKLLISPANPLDSDPRVRQARLQARLKEGKIISHCEVVRDLTAHGWDRSLTGAMAAFLFSAQDVLCQEWAAIEEISLEDAVAEVIALLEASRRVQKNR